MFCAPKPRTCQKYPKCIQKKCKSVFWDLLRYVLRTEAQDLSKVSQMHPEKMQVHFVRFALLCSARRSPELVNSIPNASRKMQVHFLRYATLCSAHRSPELVKSIPNASRSKTKRKCMLWDLRRCALRTEAHNFSKVSKMHPEQMQVYVFGVATLCSAHRSPELVKSIP